MRKILGACLLLLVSCEEPAESKRNNRGGTTSDGCDSGDRRCVGDVLKICRNDEWRTELDCQDVGAVCENAGGEATCVLSGECETTGASTCVGDVAMVCTGEWEELLDCTENDQVCDDSDGMAVCVDDGSPNNNVDCEDGEEDCDGDTIVECNDGEWEEVQDCGDTDEVCAIDGDADAFCDEGTTPAVCDEGAQRCGTNRVQTCDGEGWVNGPMCVGDCVEIDEDSAACEGDAPSPFCAGSASYVCDGSEVVVCDGEMEQGRYDCADVLGDGSVEGVCHEFGGEWEADCLLQEAEPCFFTDGEQNFVIACGSETAPSATMGCNMMVGCVAGVDECTPGEDFEQSCQGNLLTIGCMDYSEVAQPILFDCTSADVGAGTCNATDNICEHSTVDGYCDNEAVRCIAPLTCTIPPEAQAGTCTSP